MYKKYTSSFFKHLDFYLLDGLSLEISLVIAYIIRHGLYNPFANDSYRELFIVLFFIDIVVMLFLDTMKNVLKRGYYREFVATVWQSLLLFLVTSTFLFSTKTGSDYSRIVIYVGIANYILLSYAIRLLWKRFLKRFLRNRTNNALLIIANKYTASNLIKEVKTNNYGQHKIVGLVVRDESIVGTSIDDVPVVAIQDNN
ncbi:MAG: hypothetical protein MJ093_09500 [Saccharofermentans sp.]|nr:hypothetical protein [Saccharofermentans sp.]